MRASAFFKRAANDLRSDRRCTRWHPNHRQVPIGVDTRWVEAAPRELRDDGAKRSALARGKLSSRRDHVVVDVQSRAHGLMLAHQRINSGPAVATGGRSVSAPSASRSSARPRRATRTGAASKAPDFVGWHEEDVRADRNRGLRDDLRGNADLGIRIALGQVVDDAADQGVRDLEHRWRIRRGQAGRLVLLHPGHHLADWCAAGKDLVDEHVEDIGGGASFLIGHTSKSLGGAWFSPSSLSPTCRQTKSNGDHGLNDEAPDLSEASISSDFEVAGAGFEPATFGL
jgi:hypothetical protein